MGVDCAGLKGCRCSWALSILALAGLVLVLVNIALTVGNASRRDEAGGNQQYINESVKLSNLNNRIVQRLAVLSADNNDPQLKALLNEHGITYTIKPPAKDQGVPGNAQPGRQP